MWRTEGVNNVFYDRNNRLITFTLDTLGPVTLIQNAHILMPYKSWELRPLGVNEAILTVTTAFTEIQIQIKVSDFLAGPRVGSPAASRSIRCPCSSVAK